MPNNDPLSATCERVGRFLYYFSRVEMQLDEAITKLFKLDPQIAPIVTVNIDFFRKLNIVRCAVQYQNDNTPRKKKISTTEFGKLGKENEARQVIAHSGFEPDGAEAVQFKRSVARQKLKPAPRWTKHEFEQHFKALQKLETDLRKMVSELDPDRIEWNNVLATPRGLPAYLTPFTDSGWLVQHS
jgi:hypothetical protein